jgi:hypothetical protein
MAGVTFHDELGDYRRYEQQIARLDSRHRGFHQNGLSLTHVNFHRSKVARMLARTVSEGRYESAPARRKTIVVNGKERVIFSYQLTDLIVHGTVAELIAEAMESSLSARLYSYRKGISWWSAVSDFAGYLRAYRKDHPDPRTRHMYVVRRDVDSYTDSIPVGDGAPVWEMLRELLAAPSQAALHPRDWQLVERVVRPEVENPGGDPIRLERGVPTGQPISCILFNLYLRGLDRRMESVEHGFYARYSDDILFAHPCPEVARQAAAEMEGVLERLGLRFKKAKSLDLYLTGAGRPSSDWPEAVGACAVPLMGASVRADGTVSLGKKKTHRLLREIVVRTRRTARSLNGMDLDDFGRMICSVINRIFQPDSATFLEARSAALVRRAITDRRQLAQLDHWIARIVLRAVTGDGSVRLFRHISCKKMRTEWGLMSLEHARNLWGRWRRT